MIEPRERNSNRSISFTGANEAYIVEQYEQYLKDPSSVSSQLKDLFSRWSPASTDLKEVSREVISKVDGVDYDKIVKLIALVQAIRNIGYMASNLDPVSSRSQQPVPSLEATTYGLTEDDLNKLPPSIIHSRLSAGASSASEVVAKLKQAYCGSTGYDYSHLRSPEERAWFEEAIESNRFLLKLDPQGKRSLLERLTAVEVFEQFLHRTFPGQTWFSAEGNDSMIPMMDEIVKSAHASPIQNVVMGMAHRGRLNVLAHIIDKSYRDVLSEFKDLGLNNNAEVDSEEGVPMKDVKYHQGAHKQVKKADGTVLDLILLPNPSHLEMVNPVVLGATRAIQSDAQGKPVIDKAVGVLLHGDAAFSGEGIVPESLNLSSLDGYQTGGTLHIIINNQLGFTTEPDEGHSTPYTSDLARGFDIPVVRVNADDLEACLAAARMSFAYRQRFHKDFLIDLIGYRRYGHNEGDEPAFTQPTMYEKIRNHPTARALFADKLVKESALSPEQAQKMVDDAFARWQTALDSLSNVVKDERAPASEKPKHSHVDAYTIDTTLPNNLLNEIDDQIHKYPADFTLNPKLERPFRRRRELRMMTDGKVDWAYAETLAFASILAEGTPIRLSGQDSERGTFSQRHAVLHDAKTGAKYSPLKNMAAAKASFTVFNSPLSEEAVIGFEYGYSVESPGHLVLLEAQYGDFVNNAQGVIDEFIASSKTKWGQRASLGILLPHAHEGQGPDHTTGYIERFLQLCANSNMRVAYCSNAAQYFHVLRRQAKLAKLDPKPLVLFTAKSLLRHPLASSSVTELTNGSFQPVLDDPQRKANSASVQKVIFCTGKVYVDITSNEEYAKEENLAVIRIEELYPFPAEHIASVLNNYKSAKEFVWLQEETQNRGAWSYIASQLQSILKSRGQLGYVGRASRPSPAEGSSSMHKMEQERIMREALSGSRKSVMVQGVRNG